MNRGKLIALLIFVTLLMAGCGPSIVVQNKTTFPVRVIVSASGKSEVLSPSPGESSAAAVSEGAYRVTVIPDAEWIEYAKISRKLLNDQLANSDKLSGPQLLEVIRQLKDIAARMQQYESAAGAGASCSGRIAEDSGGVVTVSTAADGKLSVSCR